MSFEINKMDGRHFLRDYIEYLIFALSLFLIFISRLYSFLLFHSIAELMSIIISGGIFIVGWNTRKYMDNSFFLVIGISFLYIAIIDLLHTLAYADMQIFIEYNANLPTQLWISARYWQAFSFLIGSFVIHKKVNSIYLFALSTIIISILIPSIFLKIFPDCYIVGLGLTPFKIISEYIIDIILFISLILLYINRKEFNKKIFILVVLSIINTMASELVFTLYIGVFDLPNVIGHLLKIVASFFAYKAIIETGLENPFNLLFRKLKLSQQRLEEKAIDLELAFSEADQLFNASLPLRVMNTNYEILKVNDTFCRLFQMKKEEILGKKCYDIFPLKFCKTKNCTMQQILNGKDLAEYEIEFELKNKKALTLIVNSVPFREVKGKFIGLIQTYTDISERKQIENKLKESEEKYRKLIEDSLMGVWVTDENARTTLVNKSMANILGYSVEEIMGKTQYEFLSDESKKDALKKFDNIKRGQEEIHEFEFLHKTGRKVFALIKETPLFNDQHEFIGGMAFISDITEQKRAQEKVKDIASLPLENPNPILRVSRKYVLIVNESAQRLFTIGEGSKIPKLLKEYVNETFINEKFKEVELELNDKIYSFFITPIVGANYVNIYGRDITERKKAEKRLERFVSTVSHELRTPISVLIMSMDFLNNHKEKVTPEIEFQLKDAISRNIILLNELVDDVLTLSRIDEKKIKLVWEEYSPREIINDILTLMEPIGKNKEINFNIDIDANIHLFGDLKRIDQIFRIFIDNAIKYSKKGSKIEIKAINNYYGPCNINQREGVLFQIKDQGMGISEKDLPYLFERFFRSEQVSDIPGTGLGLSIAEELIKLHDGETYVESEYGKGTIFSIFLPKIKNQP